MFVVHDVVIRSGGLVDGASAMSSPLSSLSSFDGHAEDIPTIILPPRVDKEALELAQVCPKYALSELAKLFYLRR